jgi:hypothetical protein
MSKISLEKGKVAMTSLNLKNITLVWIDTKIMWYNLHNKQKTLEVVK